MKKDRAFLPELQEIAGFTRVKPTSVKPPSVNQIVKLARSPRGDDRAIAAILTIALECGEARR